MGCGRPPGPGRAGTQQTLRRLAPRPPSRTSPPGTRPRRLQGPGPAVRCAFPTPTPLPRPRGARRSPTAARAAHPSGPTAVGPKPLGATVESARPLGAVARPAAEHGTPTLVAGKARGRRPWPPMPLPPPAVAQRRREGLSRRQPCTDTPADRWLRRSRLAAGGGGQVRAERLAGRTDGPRACGAVWVRASHPRSVTWAAGYRGRLSGRLAGQGGGQCPLQRALWWEGPEETGPAEAPGRAGGGGRRGERGGGWGGVGRGVRGAWGRGAEAASAAGY